MPTFREDIKLGTKVPLMKTDDISDKAITNRKLADNSVDENKIEDGSITEKKLSSPLKSIIGSISDVYNNYKQKFDSLISDFEKKGKELVSEIYTPDSLSPSLKQYIDSRGGGTVTNMADDEDLTTVNENGIDVLKLKDRAYRPDQFSGMGYKILRPNIKLLTISITNIVVESAPATSGDITITIDGVTTTVSLDAATDTTAELVAQKIADALSTSLTDYTVTANNYAVSCVRRYSGVPVESSKIDNGSTDCILTISDTTKKNVRKNILTGVMLNSPNTIYEIRYDFDLDGETVEVAEGCTLKFEGGSLRNGVLKLNNTNIVNAKNSLDVVLSGSCANEVISSLWTTKLNYLQLSFSNKTISIDKEETISSPLLLSNEEKITWYKMLSRFAPNDIVPLGQMLIENNSL